MLIMERRRNAPHLVVAEAFGGLSLSIMIFSKCFTLSNVKFCKSGGHTEFEAMVTLTRDENQAI